jgi:predicted DNA-binding transcriptional regulator AlpA
VADIAERCGVHRQTVHQWVVGSRGPGGFPAPLRAGGGVRVWRWSAVAAWLEEHGLALGLAEQARTLAQVNAALEVSRAPEPIRALAGVA